MNPEQFYSNDDMPNKVQKEKMWTAIHQSNINKAKHKTNILQLEKKSFAAGMVASFIIILSLAGGSELYRMTGRGEESVSLQAYSRAIEEFESAVKAQEKSMKILPENDEIVREIRHGRQRQIQLIDEEIQRIVGEMSDPALQTFKKEKIQQLYRMKLTVMQDIVEITEFGT